MTNKQEHLTLLYQNKITYKRGQEILHHKYESCVKQHLLRYADQTIQVPSKAILNKLPQNAKPPTISTD